MLRTIAGLVVSSIFFSAAAGAQSSSSQVTPHFILTWNDHYRLLPQGYDSVTRKIETLFAEMAIAVSWREENAQKKAEPAGVHVQIVLRTDPSQWGLPEHTMGVVIGKKVPRGSAFIFVPNVLRTLGYEPVVKPIRPPKEVALIARGLARVVAHELVHAIVPEHGHDSAGLLASKLKRGALTWRHLDLAPPTRELLLARLVDPANLVEAAPLAP